MTSPINVVIYCHTNKVNGKKYIGQTRFYADKITPERAIEKRWRVGYRACRVFSSAVCKYGRDGFDSEVLVVVIGVDAGNETETRWIKKLRTLCPNGYNLDSGGGVRKIMHQASRNLLSASQRRHFNNMTRKEKIAFAQQRSEATRKGHASKTPEQRSAVVRKGWASLTKEQRSERQFKAAASITPETRTAITEKRLRTMTPERRQVAARKRVASQTPAQHSDRVRKGWASLTAEQRSDRARRRQQNMTPEQRRTAMLKGWANTTPERRAERVQKIREGKLKAKEARARGLVQKGYVS